MRSQTGASKMDKSTPFGPDSSAQQRSLAFLPTIRSSPYVFLTHLPRKPAQLASSLHKTSPPPQVPQLPLKKTWHMGWRTANCVV